MDQKKAGGFFVRFDCGSDPRSSVLTEVYPQMSRTAKASRPQNRSQVTQNIEFGWVVKKVQRFLDWAWCIPKGIAHRMGNFEKPDELDAEGPTYTRHDLELQFHWKGEEVGSHFAWNMKARSSIEKDGSR